MRYYDRNFHHLLIKWTKKATKAKMTHLLYLERKMLRRKIYPMRMPLMLLVLFSFDFTKPLRDDYLYSHNYSIVNIKNVLSSMSNYCFLVTSADVTKLLILYFISKFYSLSFTNIFVLSWKSYAVFSLYVLWSDLYDNTLPRIFLTSISRKKKQN